MTARSALQLGALIAALALVLLALRFAGDEPLAAVVCVALAVAATWFWLTAKGTLRS